MDDYTYLKACIEALGGSFAEFQKQIVAAFESVQPLLAQLAMDYERKGGNAHQFQTVRYDPRLRKARGGVRKWKVN